MLHGHDIHALQVRNDTLEQQFKSSMPLLKQSFIQSLLHHEQDLDHLSEQAAYYGMASTCSYYTVMCMELRGIRGQTNKDVYLFTYAVINISSEIMHRTAEGWVFRVKGTQLLAVCESGTASQSVEHIQSNMLLLAEEIRAAVEQALSIMITLGVGRAHQGLHNIHASYQEAQEALQYQLVEGGGKVLFIERLNTNAGDYDVFMEADKHITAALKLANLGQAREHLKLLYDHLLQRTGHLNYQLTIQGFMQLIAGALKIAHEADSKKAASLFGYNLYCKLTELRSLHHMIHWLENEVYPKVVNVMSDRYNRQHLDIVQRALDYIHDHYNEDLSQPLVAGRLSVSNSEFSHLFKEAMGCNFSDYVLTYRMEKAKELLSSTYLKISEIAEELQYNNSQNFIRTFKRVVGMTPGEYRHRNSSSERKITS